MNITINKNHPMPTGRFMAYTKRDSLRIALQKMQKGDSFDYEDNKAVFAVSKQLGIQITTRKLNGSGYRVWRVE